MAYDNIVNALIRTESGGNPMAINPRSSAGGAGQFINSTWLTLVKKYRPDIASGKTDAQLLQLKYDPNLAREMVTKYADENSGFLSQRGFAPTPGNIKLAHFAGPQGASNVLANPNDTVRATLGDSAVKANPFMRNYTNADLAAWASRSMGNEGGGGGPSGSPVQKSDRSTADKILSALGVQVKNDVASLENYDQNNLSRAETLINNAQKIGGRGDIVAAIGGPILAALGGYQRDQEIERKKAENQRFIERVTSGQKVPPIVGALLESSDPARQNLGLMQLMKMGAPKSAPQIQEISGTDQYGRPTKSYVQWNGSAWVPLNSGGQVGQATQPASLPGGSTQAPAVQPSGPQQLAQPQPRPQPVAQPVAQPQPQPSVGVNAGPQTVAREGKTGIGAWSPQTVTREGKTGMNVWQPQPPAPQQPMPQPPQAQQQQQTAPAPQPPKAASQLPPGVEPGPVAPKTMIGEGYVQDVGPDGSPLWRRTAVGLQPVLITKEQLAARTKTQVNQQQVKQQTDKVAQQFAGGIERLRGLPKEFGRAPFERALGPLSADDATTSGGGAWGTGISLSGGLQQLARGKAELMAEYEGGATPTEVRDRLNTTVKNIAAVMKPMVRKPGEGAWTDKDQENLEAQIGKLDRSRSLEEYMRRINDIEENMRKIFKVNIPYGALAPRRP
jgi:hypothetical protein